MISTSNATRPRRRLVAALAATAACLLLPLPMTAAAAPTGAVAGKVTDAATHAALSGIEACAYKAVGFPAYGGCATSNAEGKYTITGLTPASYRLHFSTSWSSELNYLPQNFNGRSDGSFDPVAVAATGTTTGIDAALLPGGQITGTVSDESDDPLENAQVCVYRSQASEENVGCRYTTAAGKYTISSLSSGSYKVRFSPGTGETSPGHFGTLNYITQYYDGKASSAEATPVAVTAGTASAGIDAQMQVGGVIAGTVTDAASNPLASVEVCAYRPYNQFESAGCAQTGADGEYRVQGLGSGSYKIAFKPTTYAGKYAGQYSAGKDTFAKADPIAVSAGATTPGIDATLQEQGGLAGTVTAASGGGALAGIQVCANQVFSFKPEPGHGCDTTDGAGEYEIPRLPSGSYYVKFDGGDNYVDQYFDDAGREGEAEPAAVTLAATTTGIDAALRAAAKVEGTVVSADSETGLEGFEVCAYSNPEYSISDACATTDGSGQYSIGGLAGATYRVGFSPPFSGPNRNYIPSLYDGRTSFSKATPIVVAAGAVVGSIDAKAQVGGQIAGVVRDEAEQPLEEISVCATPVSAPLQFGNCASTDVDGKYTIDGLASGQYDVEFRPGFHSGNLQSQFYADQPTRKTASPVTVAAGSKTSGVDAHLHPGGIVTGRIVDADSGDPISNAMACAARPAKVAIENCLGTDSDGKYTIEGLSTGSYEIVARPLGSPSPYLRQRYDDKAPDEAGDLVAVTGGATTPGIDFALHRGGRISGHVIDFVSKAAVETIWVCARPVGVEPEEGECDTTDASGGYAIEGLRPGSYKLRFSPGFPFVYGEPADPNYVTQYYDGKLTEAEAAPIAVGAGANVDNVDAEMRQGGGISGHVTGPLGEPLHDIYVCAEIAGETEAVDCQITDAGGSYELEGLGDHAYTVQFTASGTGANLNFLTEFYDGKSTAASSTPVLVAGAAVTTGVDAQLQAGGRIHGRVTDAGDESPLREAFVCVYEVGAEEALTCAEANFNGEYSFSALAAGSYQVEFSVGQEDEDGELMELFATQFYPGKSVRAQAGAVSVSLGATTGSIDARMFPPGTTPSTLSVAKAGNGSGTVSSSPSGIACGATCSGSFLTGSTVTLTASPAAGSTFSGWSGACSGNGGCQVSLGADTTVTATFSLDQKVDPPPPGPPPTPAKPTPAKRLTCKKGFKRIKVHGKARCVKLKKHRKHGKR